jgi:lipid A 3-O-deacylase
MKKTVCFLMLLGMPLFSHAGPGKTHVTFGLENDAFIGEDDGFTNGIIFHWGYAPFDKFDVSNTPSWVRSLTERLYISTMPGKQRAISYNVSQTIQTPDDITVKQLQVDDVPYMGLLSWKVSLHAFDDEVTDKLSLILGVVGPLSFAEQTQKGFHKVINADDPQGWDNQLDTEPVFRVDLNRNWRLLSGQMKNHFGYDVIGLSQLSVGTISSETDVGMTVRFGRSLDRTFPLITLIPGREINPVGTVKKAYYFYLGGVVRYVANDIAIDGNTFRDSHSQDLRHDQYVITAGFNVSIGDIAITLSYVDTSKQVVGSTSTDPFGALSVSWSY